MCTRRTISRKTVLRIIEVYEGSGAEEVGLKHGDEIVGAGDKTLEKDGYQAVIDAIAGDEGTDAQVMIRHADTGETETWPSSGARSPRPW